MGPIIEQSISNTYACKRFAPLSYKIYSSVQSLIHADLLYHTFFISPLFRDVKYDNPCFRFVQTLPDIFNLLLFQPGSIFTEKVAVLNADARTLD
jgi:hypothetical protein